MYRQKGVTLGRRFSQKSRGQDVRQGEERKKKKLTSPLFGNKIKKNLIEYNPL